MNRLFFQSAFTLLEGVVVMAIITITASVIIPFYGFFIVFSDMNAIKIELLGNLRLAEDRSQSRLGDIPFGIYLEPQKYTLYQGDSYETRISMFDKITFLEDGVTLTFYGFPLIGNAVDLHFALVTGFPNNSGTIVITHPNKKYFIFVNDLGVISEGRSGRLTLYPLADATIIQTASNTNYGSDINLQTYPWAGGNNRRALLRFDLGNIPYGATIQSANLFLYETGVHDFDPRVLNLHRVSNDWKENEVSWNKYQTSSSWSVPGGDFLSTPSASKTLQWNYTPKWDSWDLRADVDDIVSEGVANYGWLLKDQNEDSSQDYWFFSSKEGSFDPYLLIEYSFL